MIKKMFYNKGEIFNCLEVYPTFDRQKSGVTGGWCFVTTDGKVHRKYSLKSWLQELNDVLGTTFITDSCVKVGSMYRLCYEEDFPKEVVGGISFDEGTLADVDTEVNWEWCESLKNTQEDKLKLDEYAEGFGVKLNRRNKIDKMLSMFKDEMNKEN